MESGGGGLVATMDDYAQRFARCSLNGGELKWRAHSGSLKTIELMTARISLPEGVWNVVERQQQL